jgi:transketolase
MRVIPNFETWRAADAIESAVSWKEAIVRGDAPTALVFSRQNLTPMERTTEQVANIAKGGYVLKDCEGTPDLIMIATGSEVDLAVNAAREMSENIRVVSMPSTCRFDKQDDAYKDSVLIPGVKRVAIEASLDNGWYKYVGLDGAIVGMKSFGESAPAGELFKEFGFTVENVVATAKKVLNK